MNQHVARVRPQEQTMNRRHIPNFVGISGDTVGSTAICMNVVALPPGGAATPHQHEDYETAIYLLKGRVNTRYGEGLTESVICEEGNFLFVGPDVPQLPVNLSDAEPAMAVVARIDPNEQEHVLLYDADGDVFATKVWT